LLQPIGGFWPVVASNIAVCVGAFEVNAKVPHLYRANSHQGPLFCMFGWYGILLVVSCLVEMTVLLCSEVLDIYFFKLK